MNADAVEDLIEDMEEATFVSETVEESVLAEMVDHDLTAERLVQMVIRVQRAYRLATYVYRNFGPTLFVAPSSGRQWTSGLCGIAGPSVRQLPSMKDFVR